MNYYIIIGSFAVTNLLLHLYLKRRHRKKWNPDICKVCGGRVLNDPSNRSIWFHSPVLPPSLYHKADPKSLI